jgi:hypothetical protein
MSAETATTSAGRQPPKLANKIMKFLLRTPLHGVMSRHIMLITFRGRKSGKEFTTPIGYERLGNTVRAFTDHSWWKNFTSQPEVTLTIQGRRYPGTAEAVHDDKETIAKELQAYIQHSPMAARAFSVEVDASGKAVPASARQAAERLTLVRVHLK